MYLSFTRAKKTPNFTKGNIQPHQSGMWYDIETTNNKDKFCDGRSGQTWAKIL